MIKSIVLKNYCSHKNTVIDFTEDNITVTGTNNIGKTTLLNGIRTLLFCGDLPDQDIRRGTNECILFAEFEDGRTVTRTKKGSKQEYILKHANGKCETLSNITQIRSRVQEFTGFKPVQLNKNETAEDLQIVDVDDHTFLIGKGPEVVLRCLSGMIAGRGVETAKININKRLSEVTSTIKVRQKDLSDEIVKSNLLNSKQITKLFQDYDQFQHVLNMFLDKEERYDRLVELNKSISQCTFSGEEIEQLEIDLEDCVYLGGKLKQLAELQNRILEVQTIRKRLMELDASIWNNQQNIASLETEVKTTNLTCVDCDTCGKTTLCQKDH